MNLTFTVCLLAQPAPTSRQTALEVPRVKLIVQTKRDLNFPEAINSVTVIEPETLNASVINNSVLHLEALDFGETLVLIQTASGRQNLIVEVVGQPLLPVGNAGQQFGSQENFALNSRISGMITTTFAPPLSGAPAFLQNTFNFQRTLRNENIFRLTGETQHRIGGSGFNFSNGDNDLGFNRLTASLISKRWTLEMLDTNLSISPLTFNGFALRGARFVNAENSPLPGAEIFAGAPLTYEGETAKQVFGAIVPLKNKKDFRLRMGAMFVTQGSGEENASNSVLNFDSFYSPNENLKLNGELSVGARSISGRAAVNWQTEKVKFFAEGLHLDSNSPFVSVRAQNSRSYVTAAVQYQPASKLFANASFTQSRYGSAGIFRRASLGGSSFNGGLSYRLKPDTQLGFRYSRQKLSTTETDNSPFELQTENFSANFTTGFLKNWSANLEGNYLRSRETNANLEMERGYYGRAEIRRAWETVSASIFANYAQNTPSLANLVIRNPSLLPPLARAAFQADPARFLAQNQNLLTSLLANVALPETQNSEIGLRLNGTGSRFSWLAETRYGNRENGGVPQKSFQSILNFTAKLDAANSLSLGFTRSQSLAQVSDNNHGNNFSSVILTYTHRFGSAGLDGFQFLKLFGFDRASVEGRVFSDSDSDGEDDSNEPGIAGIQVQINNGKIVTTDSEGRFRFKGVKPGRATIAIISKELGTTLNASTPSEQELNLSPGKKEKVSFGLTSFGFIGGRVFNDASDKTADGANDTGIGEVKVRLRPKNEKNTEAMLVLTRSTEASGDYEFRRLKPGEYILEFDENTFPPDYDVPLETLKTVSVEPLKGVYIDLPLRAQRAVSGVVFIDKDGNGQFDAKKDQPIEGAVVKAAGKSLTTGKDGAYFLRQLPAGNLEIRVSVGDRIFTKTLQLGANPVMMRAVNFSIKP